MKTVDTRLLKNGQKRLRFKLNNETTNIVAAAIKLTKCQFKNVAIDCICMSFICCHGDGVIPPSDTSAQGNSRFILRLYEDQYELVRKALNYIREFTPDDETALLYLCQWFCIVGSGEEPLTRIPTLSPDMKRHYLRHQKLFNPLKYKE